MQDSFFNKYKVLILGLLTAVLLALQEVFKEGNETSTKVIVFAAFLAALSFLAQNLRGQWATIAGIIGTAVSTYVTMEQQGHVSWPQIILQMVLALLAVFTPPAKSRGYEHTPTIENARYQGEKIAPSTAKK